MTDAEPRSLEVAFSTDRTTMDEVEAFRARCDFPSRSAALHALVRRGLKDAARAQCHAAPPALVLGRVGGSR